MFPPPSEILYKLKNLFLKKEGKKSTTWRNIRHRVMCWSELACWTLTEKVRRAGREGSSLLFAKEAEPLLFVFLFVLLPLAGTRLAGDGDAGG